MRAVEALKDRFGIAPILRVLGVAASTYYGWLGQRRDPSRRRRCAAAVGAQLRVLHAPARAPDGAHLTAAPDAVGL